MKPTDLSGLTHRVRNLDRAVGELRKGLWKVIKELRAAGEEPDRKSRPGLPKNPAARLQALEARRRRILSRLNHLADLEYQALDWDDPPSGPPFVSYCR